MFNYCYNFDFFFKLLKHLRCLVCFNYSLYDSSSDFAVELKELICKMITYGYSYDDIMFFLIDNYGIFISYTPYFNFYSKILILVLFFSILFFLLLFLFFLRK